MGLKSFFKGLAGGGDTKSDESKRGEAVTYLGYVITPAPQSADGQFRIAGSIAKAAAESDASSTDASSSDAAGEQPVHEFIRADLTGSWEEACTMSVDKAKRIIDEQGDAIFK